MQPTNVARARREELRQRLHNLIATKNTADLDSIARQIDDLLETAFEDEDFAPQPDPVWVNNQPEDQRVVITGLGVVSPLGIGIDAFWNGLVEGRSGIRQITLCDPGDSPSRIAAEVVDFNPLDYVDAKEARRMSRASQFAVCMQSDRKL